MNSIIESIEAAPGFSRRQHFSGLNGAAKAAVITVLTNLHQQVLVITSSSSGAERLRNEVAVLSGKTPQVLPPPQSELSGERLAVIAGLLRGEVGLVIASLKAALVRTNRRQNLLSLTAGQSVRVDQLIKQLLELGYKRFDIVGERGEFSVRGGIIDIFPANQALPCRLEFWEDRIESLRSFDPYSQRSEQKMTEAAIFPAVEKAEARLVDLLPPSVKIVLDEPLELNREEEKLPAGITLSAFVGAGEEALFSTPESYLGRLAEIPPGALIFSRHAPRLREEWPELKLVFGELRGGFVYDGQVVLSDRELFGEEYLPRKKETVRREGVADELLADLKIGDYVVHENYGIGLYQGMRQLAIDGIDQEYLLIEYAEGDKLYVPPAMAGLVEKYQGGRETKPRLSRLGTQDWLKTRSRVKQAVKEMTAELLQIYAARAKLAGHPFPPDDLWQKELEATFPYEETADQLKAIAAVKQDMESERPMDRLICGDVGYGKTEVALRAAVKAAAAGKQVALLAPTTILVEQHYNNFKQRLQNLPFVVEMLSRFRSAREQTEVIKGLALGGVDIVVGTHRLLSRDIKFKDLGLLIVDEEQKFGVTHKEKLKKLRQTVDVLTMSATPIPRTLYFSLSGIREMSQITTPPIDRSPIKTYVLPYAESVIKEAILREIDRGGQVYFVHNYVNTIAGVAARIKRLAPNARVAVGHGQMEEKKLEKTMLDFLDRKYDVLVCTSIIESGLDIPTVNTILIDRAERFGLSQLYQIRGRVGRSAVKAYAYLFYHPARSMSDEAVERLKAIQEFTALGSGYKLAMRDLEIRGAGNLLGAEQSGHIYEVGFDLYCELLQEAVKELKGEKIVPLRDVEVDLKVVAAIPPDYVTDERQRIALYRRMNLITTAEGVAELKKELLDRFGKIPPQLATLLRLVKLKTAALAGGVKSLKEQKEEIKIEWLSGKTETILVNTPDKIALAGKAIGYTV